MNWKFWQKTPKWAKSLPEWDPPSLYTFTFFDYEPQPLSKPSIIDYTSSAFNEYKINSQFARLTAYFQEQVDSKCFLTQIYKEMDPWCIVIDGRFSGLFFYHDSGEFLMDKNTGLTFGKFVYVKDNGEFRFRTSSTWVDHHRGIFSLSSNFGHDHGNFKPHRDAESELWDD